jgi:hypothetical protein
MMTGTRVTCEDLETGESESRVIQDDYILVTDGAIALDSVQVYSNGTVVLTVKRKLVLRGYQGQHDFNTNK